MSQLKLLEQSFLEFDEKLSREFYKFMGDNEGKSFSINDVPVLVEYDFDYELEVAIPKLIIVNKLVCEKHNFHFLTSINNCQYDVDLLTPEGMYNILIDLMGD